MQQILARIVFIMLLSTLWAVPLRAAEDEKPAAKPESAAPKEASPPKEEGEGAPKKKSDDVSGGRFEGDPVYVHLTPMVLPVISEEGAEQLVTLIIDVEVKDFNVADTMHAQMPRVKDSLMRALYGSLGKGNLRNGKLIDVAKIKTKIAAALTEVVGDGVKEVLVQGVAQRML